jgi:hypothetical protein
MKHTTEKYMEPTGDRRAMESFANLNSERKALEACVDDFAEKMKAKLIQKNLEGKAGWDDPDWSIEDLKRQLIDHVEKGDFVDVANFALFGWNKG